MTTLSSKDQFHYNSDITNTDYANKLSPQVTKITYTFFNHFHPSVGKLVEKLNAGDSARESLAGLFNVDFQISLADDFFKADYGPNESDPKLEVNYDDTKNSLDLGVEGAYSMYNWELFFHAPIATAINLSKNQRFDEAQKWFHYIFDPTSNDKTVLSPMRFWKFRQFRENVEYKIDELFRKLNEDPESTGSKQFAKSIEDWRNYPFQPHRIARTRFLAYQFNVVMKYLDNLIAWGDSLFRQDTIETINEATQIYILAANILGPKPQQSPRLGKTTFKTYASLKKNLDQFGNALVEMEGYFPFNLSMPSTGSSSTLNTNPLFGITKALYFCIPKNENLLAYWSTVADRLFKIRHCANIEGIVRQLPLFEPPIDPGMLVKAAAAGIDIGSLVSGLYQPLSLVRAPLVIQKALEICNEVKNLGNSLLLALEKKDAEKLSLLRQEHEIKVLQLVEDVKFLQWKESEAATQALWYTRNTIHQRYQHYQLILEKITPDLTKVKDLTVLQNMNELNKENFDEIYNGLVSQFGEIINLAGYRKEKTSSDLVDQLASFGSGLLGSGDGANLELNVGESKELNTFMPLAHEFQKLSSVSDVIASALSLIPQVKAHATPVGVGAAVDFGGVQLSKTAEIGSRVLRLAADEMNYRGNRASKLASYQRRIDEWVLQNNLAASELMQIGRQIISSLIREQISKKEYDNQKEQIKNAQEIDAFLNAKFSNHDLYIWMQGEISRVYYDCYKFAFDVAKKAEQIMKYELMSKEVDDINFVKFNYWDSGRNGLLSGEGLYLDLKRMEMAYLDHNKREYEITKHISLQQLDPKSLLQLKATGSCQIIIPEWLFDMDCPGHYMRRIKTVSLSIPCVAGPYTSVNCTLSLLKNTVRVSPIIDTDGYARIKDAEDARFKDYYGTIQSIVTSNAQNDSGLFETNLRDERYLPFEGAGAESIWKLELPSEFKQFDYNSISDVILHFRYTSREGGAPLKSGAISYITTEIVNDAKASGLIRSFSLKHDFPTEWYKFISSKDKEDFKIVIRKDHFPYVSTGFNITIGKVELFSITDAGLKGRPLGAGEVNTDDLSAEINDAHKNNQSELPIKSSADVLTRAEDEQVFLALSYTLE